MLFLTTRWFYYMMIECDFKGKTGGKMDLNSWLLVAAAILPAIVLCVYIYRKDRVDKEPFWLLMQLFTAGALCCYPAAWLEGTILDWFDVSFFGVPEVVYQFCKYFLCVAVAEEGLKWIAMRLLTKRILDFNSWFDGLVYAIFVSLGFATLENVLYVTEYGWVNALMRGVLSVPGHMFFAVLMGYYYALSHSVKKAAVLEKELKHLGLVEKNIKPLSSLRFDVYSLLVPIAAHGCYNFCCTWNTASATVAFYGFILFLYIYCFGKIRRMSATDAPDRNYAKAILMRKYPHLNDFIYDEL